ncbi:ABC-2 type transport system permease protein [Cohnella sp. OV330]|uniref:ABC transporter permease n=1 Tax=Cohnella sp. OV330 TaxID=1855288 RepID=UPI0008EB8C6B|nr:ABC-2 family transporter protein [Cohnella sp. OV330]SFB59286.1 ABC-2 type transport system permease protein [Cohnella sp. OV330]
MTVLWVLARSAYESRLQYTASHAVRTVASVIFGMIYISIWQGIGDQYALEGYGREGMVAYIAFNQVILWLTFTSHGLGLEDRVRTGQIALDLIRPVHLFVFSAGREAGSIAYNMLFTALPLYVLYALFVGLPVPSDPALWLRTLAALVMAAYTGICISYCIGVTALWTVESRWFSLLNYSLSFVLSGFLMPIAWMPGWLQTIARLSPYPVFNDIPTRTYLGTAAPSALLAPLAWCALLSLACLAATSAVRRKVEVQGG